MRLEAYTSQWNSLQHPGMVTEFPRYDDSASDLRKSYLGRHVELGCNVGVACAACKIHGAGGRFLM